MLSLNTCLVPRYILSVLRKKVTVVYSRSKFKHFYIRLEIVVFYIYTGSEDKEGK